MKKHSLITVLAAALLGLSAAAFPSAAFEPAGIVAEAATSGDFQYSVESGKATITGYTGSATSITIPSSIGGKTVTKIGNYAFLPTINGTKTPRNITAVTIPSTVTEIGSYAFSRTPLKKIVFPSSVKKVGASAFKNCTSLTSMQTNGALSFGNHAFDGCTSLLTVKIHKDCTAGAQVFSNCTSLIAINNHSAITYVTDANNLQKPVLCQDGVIQKIIRTFFYKGMCANVKFLDLYVTKLVEYVVSSETKPWMSEAVKARQLHDWLVRHCKYEDRDNGEQKGDDDNHGGGFLFISCGLNERGSEIGETVCQGWAYAYTMLLTRAGIESYVVSSHQINPPPNDLGGHSWNIVKIRGTYYQCDVTWDANNFNPADPCNTCYTYFMKSASEMDRLHNREYKSPTVDDRYSADDKSYAFNAADRLYVKYDAAAGAAALSQCNYNLYDSNHDGLLDIDYNFDGMMSTADFSYQQDVKPFFNNGFVLNNDSHSVWLYYLMQVNKSPADILWLAKNGYHIQ